MKTINFTFRDPEDIEIFVYKWMPDEKVKVKGIVQIVHGVAENAFRYEEFAEMLTNEGYIIYGNDHRGHGKTAKNVGELGYCGDDGFNWMVKNIIQLSEIIKAENPKIPIFIFGHSMGSVLVQRCIHDIGSQFRGVILSGPTWGNKLILNLGLFIANLEIKRNGATAKSFLLDKLVFGKYNKQFEQRTRCDWINRDENEVEKYINDPYCGFYLSSQLFLDLFNGIKEIINENNIEKIPKDIPIYVFAGDKDPVGNKGRYVYQMVKIYNKHNMKNITYKLYEGGRHEMLNEINKDEVKKDVVKWLDSHIM